MQEIKLTINGETGEIDIEGQGYQGMGCKVDIDELSELLGIQTVSETVKSEYARVVPVQRVRR